MPETTAMTIENVIAYLQNADSDELLRVNKLTASLVRERRTTQRIVAVAQRKPGDVGKLTGLKPAYLNGVQVEVVGVRRTRLSVRLAGRPPAEAVARFGDRQFTVPAECVVVDDAA